MDKAKKAEELTLEDLSIGQEELLDLIEDSFDVLDKTNPYIVGQKTR